MRLTGERVVAIPCECKKCGAITLWSLKEIFKRDRKQSVVHCLRCGAARNYSKGKMLRTFIRSDIRVRLGL